MVELIEEVRTLRERATVLYYAHVSTCVYQYMRINSLPSLWPRGAKSLVLFLSSIDSGVYVTEVLVTCCPVLTTCHGVDTIPLFFMSACFVTFAALV
jgi:hypothetical protein